MSDLLGEARLDEAIKYWEGWPFDVTTRVTLTGDQIIDLQHLVAAARNWHALTEGTKRPYCVKHESLGNEECCEWARSLSVCGDCSMIESYILPVDALTVTAEPGEEQ